MSILASVVADAINADGARLTTVIVRCPATTGQQLALIDGLSISRPFPTLPPDLEIKRLLAACVDDPVQFPSQPYTGPIDEFSHRRHDLMWRQFREEAVKALRFWSVNAHAPSVDIAQRVLGCWLSEVIVITATDWAPLWLAASNVSVSSDIVDVVTEIRKCMNATIPNKVEEGLKYLPFVTDADARELSLLAFGEAPDNGLTLEELLDATERIACRVSVARCARQGNGDPTIFNLKDDLRLFERLCTEGRVSRYAAHQAFSDARVANTDVWKKGHTHGNFCGWGKLHHENGSLVLWQE